MTWYPVCECLLQTYHVLDLQATSLPGSTVRICPVLNIVEPGTNYTCTIDHGDDQQSGMMYTEVLPASCLSFTYNTPGYKTIWSHCVHPANNTHIKASATAYVGENITGITFQSSKGDSYLPVRHIDNAYLLINWTTGSDVMCEVTDIGTGSLYLQESNCTNPYNMTLPFSDVGSVLGQHSLKANLTNLISSDIAEMIVEFQEEILGFSVTTDLARFVPVDFLATFDIVMTQGSDVNISQEFANINYTNMVSGQVRSARLNYTFNTPTTDLDMKIVVSNVINRKDQPYIVTVQHYINNITVDWNSIIYAINNLGTGICIYFRFNSFKCFPL